jgi:plasmid maintenance system antidote protein VapI
MAKLSARAALIKAAIVALYGERGGQTKMAASIGISKQMLSHILTGRRPVTDDVEDLVVEALGREIEHLGKTAQKLEEIQGRILAAREK